MENIKGVINRTILDITKKAIANIKEGTQTSFPRVAVEDIITIKEFLQQVGEAYKKDLRVAENVTTDTVIETVIMQNKARQVANLIRRLS